MLPKIITKIVGTKFDRDRKRFLPLVDEINRREEEMQSLSDDEVRSSTERFRARIEERVGDLKNRLREIHSELAGEIDEASEDALKAEEKRVLARLRREEKAVLDELLPEAFATVKNVCRRLMGSSWDVCGHNVTWEMIPYDVQLIGGIVLHQGRIAEMATGEGKTLVATLPLYLNALSGKNVHLVTVNDYLARRDREWMGPVFEFLGVTVGCIQGGMSPAERREVYACDITYGTNNEFGFDYLRDNMALTPEGQVQRKYFYHDADTDEKKRGHYYAIIDEVDSILIDEARTPLIISGPVTVSTQRYKEVMPRVRELSKKQAYLCNRLLKEGRELWEADRTDEAVAKFYQVKKGAPKNKQLLALIEDPTIRKLLEKNSTELDSTSVQNPRAEEGRLLREELLYTINERAHEIDLTDRGREELSPRDPEELIIPDLVTAYQEIDSRDDITPEEKGRRKKYLDEEFNRKSELIHNVLTSLKALDLYEKDVEYVVQDNQVIIVDTFTGRLMPGRRYSEGLHQALEAKEGVRIERDTQTMATVTIQNYFRLYEKLAGMTGTAMTEAEEVHKIYKLDVVAIPTNEPIRRNNYQDRVYKTKNEKFGSVVTEIEECYRSGRPTLVGTVSVDTSEVLSRLLNRRKIPHQVLNARYHQREAEIVSRAGQKGAVTIATNMAGRGTDIKLGPGVVNEECLATRGKLKEESDNSSPVPWCCVTCPVYGRCRRSSEPLCGKSRQMFDCRREVPCGLHILATERHEARRIDLQLRGRCARQGDPGSSRFYLSLEDDLMRLFGSDRIANVMGRLGLQEGEELTHPLLSRAIETAQKRVEQHNFSIREHILKYDDVINKQREEIYSFRNNIIDSPHPRRGIMAIIEEVVGEKIAFYCPEDQPPEDWDWRGLTAWLGGRFPVSIEEEKWKTEEGIAPDILLERIMEEINRLYDLKEEFEGEENMRMLEKGVILRVIDNLWLEHLYNMDDLRQGIGLRSYGQRDPLVEYKQESFKMFSDLENSLKQEVANNIFRLSTRPAVTPLPGRLVHEAVRAFGSAPPPSRAQRRAAAAAAARSGREPEPEEAPVSTFRRPGKKTGPNEPCPCGSGKKHKKCCGR